MNGDIGVGNSIHQSTPTPEAVRIILSQAASDAIASAGECGLVIGRGSYPDAVDRMVLHIIPCTMKQAIDAIDAIDVAQGRARITRTKAKP